ncbi:hypothetical protein CLV43_11012 [Umezawaea tangerina]|uniref:Uncharacterized protein n=1 Tax=Umezawaea tangerina TaxID=84725 RepID=A0A2T0SUV8_9PSEU|nr:hypothetical protein CLV43_11012 [Umezawaea tangerina]
MDRIPPADAMFTTAPPFSAIHPFRASCTNPSAATTFTSKIFRTAPRSASTSDP